MFDHLRLKNLCHLISVISNAHTEMRSLIKTRYEYQCTHYDETFAFLKNLTGIKDKDGKIRLNNAFRVLAETIDEKTIASKAIIMIQKREGPYQDQLFRYLSKYRLVDGELIYRPRDADRSEFSDLRNFLIDARVVEYKSSEDRYLLKPGQAHLYANAFESTKVLEPGVLKQQLAEKAEIGNKAECTIVMYEKERVGSEFERKVVHVALENEAAGYDIKSISRLSDDRYEPRYIEVKAVPLDTYQFFWSKNERNFAELMKDHYFLYLLPVDHDRVFSLDDLIIIQDPIAGIINSPQTWKVETETIRCSLI